MSGVNGFLINPCADLNVRVRYGRAHSGRKCNAHATFIKNKDALYILPYLHPKIKVSGLRAQIRKQWNA